MPTTMTLKGIPDELYAQLKALAVVHHRSLNSEAIACLETVLLPRKTQKQKSRQSRLYDWCPGRDSNPHDVTR